MQTVKKRGKIHFKKGGQNKKRGYSIINWYLLGKKN